MDIRKIRISGGGRGRPAWDGAAGEALTGLLFPRRCPVCGEIVTPRGQLICPPCVRMLSPVKEPVCKTCGKEVENGDIEYCRDCLRRPRTFIRNFALINYTDTARRSMAAIKYKNKKEYLDFYGEAICSRFGRRLLYLEPDCLVPVPVHPSRARSRGFNQAGLLADRIGGRLGIPVCHDGLKRVKKTLPQKELNSAERFRNLQKAFGPGNLPAGIRTAVLADDIYTTGSTMEACARILREMGVERVYGVTICIGRN